MIFGVPKDDVDDEDKQYLEEIGKWKR
jgi:hypothetical protein